MHGVRVVTGEQPGASAAETTHESPAQVLERLHTSAAGLTDEEAKARLDRYGPNQLVERRVSALRRILRYFWGPIPWMIEVAAILSAFVRHYVDLIIILVLLLFNAAVGFWQEWQAGNAVDQLKKRLALKARCRRGGGWRQIEARLLVPGDVVRLRLGDVIPADVALLDGDYLSVDQSALTGESLPVERHPGDVVYSGSAVKQGEMVGVVTATGMNTYFGRTAQLVISAKHVSHFQKAVLSIGDYLIYLTLGLVAVLILVELQRGLSILELVQFALILTVAAIPVAMPAVLSVTMAVGAVVLSKLKAIVSQLQSIEELAGLNVLCTDKTGTLTKNELTLGTPSTFGQTDTASLTIAAALACKAEDQDAIDLAVLKGVEDPHALDRYEQESFVPFDPGSKRASATIVGRDGGGRFEVMKGAPQVVLGLCEVPVDLSAEIQGKVDELATGGYRTLGVARKDDAGAWRFLGLLPLFDPPREDAAETIAAAKQHGLEVKMVTGDNLAIAREISGKLGLGKHILAADAIPSSPDQGMTTAGTVHAVEAVDGFAEVMPEHKFSIVRILQKAGRLVGMTGDGVNDAPALKQADVGIAVSGATDAARAAADLVLTAPGLSVIIRAVEEARRIFERMNAYAIYRITETIRIMIFVVLAMIVYNFYPITAIMIILLALLNDVPIMTIAYDNTWLDPQPVRWEMRNVLTVSTVLGVIGVIETFGLLIIAKQVFGLSQAEIQSFIFLKLAVAGHLTLFVARTKRMFLTKPHPAPAVLWSAIGTKALATLVVGAGWFMTPLPWPYLVLIWGYCIVWVFVEDGAKLFVFHSLRHSARHHQKFVGMAKAPVLEHRGAVHKPPRKHRERKPPAKAAQPAPIDQEREATA